MGGTVQRHTCVGRVAHAKFANLHIANLKWPLPNSKSSFFNFIYTWKWKAYVRSLILEYIRVTMRCPFQPLNRCTGSANGRTWISAWHGYYFLCRPHSSRCSKQFVHPGMHRCHCHALPLCEVWRKQRDGISIFCNISWKTRCTNLDLEVITVIHYIVSMWCPERTPIR